MFGGFRGEVWIQPGKPASQAAAYRRQASVAGASGAVGLVLGAGNHAAVVALDILHKLVIDDCVVIAKMNPVNEALGPCIKYGLVRPLQGPCGPARLHVPGLQRSIGLHAWV